MPRVIADVAGYYLAGTPSEPGMFVSLSPARVLDTRSTSPIAGLTDLPLPVLGKGGVPATRVAAVVINTTVTETPVDFSKSGSAALSGVAKPPEVMTTS